jgi:hypothetical protein
MTEYSSEFRKKCDTKRGLKSKRRGPSSLESLTGAAAGAPS